MIRKGVNGIDVVIWIEIVNIEREEQQPPIETIVEKEKKEKQTTTETVIRKWEVHVTKSVFEENKNIKRNGHTTEKII